MKTLKRNGWTTHAAFLVMVLMLLATSFVLLLPAKAEAACCGHRTTEKYYSDGTFTTQVGKCIDDECAGTYTCTGTITIYEVDTRVCCQTCTP